MEKITPQTKDITTQNINQIAQLFPQVITEKEDENGNTIKAIDFELLKQHLSKEIIEGSDERYRLDWPGKRASILKANTPITSTLKPDRESSVNFDTTENVYIEGDNFEVLKILQESYLSKIKMIYIDPPYNTGKDFVYKDNFKVSKDDYETELGTEDEEGGKLFKNTDTNGRFHSDWLSMMFERLLVARDLLTDDGVIFMSIDDNEVHNLRKIADEVFGEENFVSNIIWHKKYGAANDAKYFSDVHDHIMVFSKNKNNWRPNMFERPEELNAKYKNKDNDPRGRWIATNLSVKTYNKNNDYIIVGPTGTEFTAPPSRAWVVSKEKYQELLKDNRITFGKDGTSRPYLKTYLSEVQNGIVPTTIWSYNDAGHNIGAKSEIRDLFKETTVPFDTPKPTKLIKRIIQVCEGKNDSSEIFLDFFSGSGTSADSILQLNAEDGGNRKFIMVQIPEETDEKSEAYKAGYKTIPEIGKERIRRAGLKILKENTEKLKERKTPLDIGFRVYKTSESILKEVAKHPNAITQTNLFKDEDNIKETATDEDILTAVILDFGEKLDNPIETKTIAGSKIFLVDTDALVACFNKNIDMQVVEEIAKMKPLRAVFRDACFKDDKDLINTVESRFKQLAPNTKVHVI
jgi:adenine-specific DNA-methyltransferase